MDRFIKIYSWLVRGIIALILLQTLFFKFSAAPESVFIFSSLGIEPWGRIATGLIELIASLLLFIPATIVWGALLAAGTMLGAILSHLAILGIEVQEDGGLLFSYACLVFILSLTILWIKKEDLKTYLNRIKSLFQ
ncbi:DoxX family protein [Cytophagales bacterium LB-30]|uniref:DoxX family protein n=1 Tax=Shiella aurantiaca TaxID=3058365 RepID=A0ABT8F295_9BACT|nr:DoxX family protein [Shiella aurantiaca]MDN4164166.1 DoxX family protein [Shiella aurantiaca]